MSSPKTPGKATRMSNNTTAGTVSTKNLEMCVGANASRMFVSVPRPGVKPR